MQKRAALVEREFAVSTRGIAVSALRFSKEKMSELYAIPEDVNPRTGKKRWRRTGHLRRSEQVEVRNAYVCAVINTAAYAEPRHEAGKPGRRRINPVRENHWRDELVTTFRPILIDLRRQSVLDLLKGGRI
jgi:hypothetical protein